jgi:type 1 glutamine amidotransferase
MQAEEFLTSEQIKGILQAEGKPKGGISSPKQILFCWSKPDHPKHVHSYHSFAKSFSANLGKIKNVQTTTVEGYPNTNQWKSADLVVFNLTQNNLSGDQLAAMDDHLSQGKSIIVVHQALVQRKGYDEWAKRIGFAFSWDTPPARSKWGRGKLKISLDTQHDIFRGFPETIEVSDELYWNLRAGTKGKVSVLGKTLAPKEKKNPGTDMTKWPVFWTTEHPAKKSGKPGRVFCCVIGHPDEVAFSSSFQIVMMRAFAWCLREPSSPFLKRIVDRK